jgi:hypothetical protein
MILEMIDQARRMLHLDALEGTICRQCATDEGLDQGLDQYMPAYPSPLTESDQMGMMGSNAEAHRETWDYLLPELEQWLKSGGLLYPRYEHGHACEQPGCTARFVDCPDVGEQGYCDRLDTPIVCPAHDCRNYAPADIPADFKFRYADFGEYIFVDGVRAPLDATRKTYQGRTVTQ